MWSKASFLEIFDSVVDWKLDGVGPVDNRPSKASQGRRRQQDVKEKDESMNKVITRVFAEQLWLHRVC